MNASRNPSRADFLRLTLGGAAAAVLVAACGDKADPTPPADAATADDPDAAAATADAAPGSADAAPACAADPTVTIGNNHGHVLVVSAADVAAGVDKTYDIQGGAGHAHSVTITAAEFEVMRSADPIQVTSTAAGHTHVCTVVCA